MADQALPATGKTQALRIFAWAMVAATFVYLINNYLMFWLGWPGVLSITSDFSVKALIQVLEEQAAGLIARLAEQRA